MSIVDKKQYSFKILIIGDPGTGKTSIIRRFVHDVFTTNYKATIGVDFAIKKMVLDNGAQIYLQLWDISERMNGFYACQHLLCVTIIGTFPEYQNKIEISELRKMDTVPIEWQAKKSPFRQTERPVF